ncbi:hypothetical protein BH10PSE1_BH10PSE1_32390 [soil metagenome]
MSLSLKSQMQSPGRRNCCALAGQSKAPTQTEDDLTLYNHWKLWSEAGVVIRMMEGCRVAKPNAAPWMIAATYLKAHRTALSLAVKMGVLSGASDAQKAA